MTSLNLHAWLMLLHPWGWDGVGRDVITFVAHEHMFNATQFLRFFAGMLTFLALAHMFNATQLLRFLLA